jgi:hypothetical protein
MKLIELSNLITAIASSFAAILWRTSAIARVKTMDATNMKDMAETLKLQSRFSAFAALFATIAAIFQSVIFFYKS